MFKMLSVQQLQANCERISLQVKRIHVAQRENAIVNRLNKTKVERDPDHGQERIDRLKAETSKKRIQSEKEVRFSFYFVIPPEATAKWPKRALQRKAEAALAKARKEEKEARSYNTLFEGVEEGQTSQKSVQEMEDDFM